MFLECSFLRAGARTKVVRRTGGVYGHLWCLLLDEVQCFFLAYTISMWENLWLNGNGHMPQQLLPEEA